MARMELADFVRDFAAALIASRRTRSGVHKPHRTRVRCCAPPHWLRSNCNVMPDLYSAATRSYVMSRIRGRDTRAEVLLRRALWSAGLRGYRTHGALPGRPDVVVPRAQLAVFVDGCFWHSCPKCLIPAPASRTEYWNPSFGATGCAIGVSVASFVGSAGRR